MAVTEPVFTKLGQAVLTAWYYEECLYQIS